MRAAHKENRPTKISKPSRTASVWSFLTAEHRAELKEIFSNGTWFRKTVRDAVHRVTGRRITGSAQLQGIYMGLTGCAIGSQNSRSNYLQLSPAARAQVQEWWTADPRVSYGEMRGRILQAFGIQLSVGTITKLWQAEVACLVIPPLPAPPPPQPPSGKTIELQVTLREGEQVQGVAKLELELHSPGADHSGPRRELVR
jgi:hypothetical protein